MTVAPLAVLGATGFTGALVCAEARKLGLPLRLVGRRREALEAMAQPGEEIRVADAGDEALLREAFDGAFAVASIAGPFLDVGTAPVAAAVAVGAHYVDTSGEQAFARLVYDDFGPRAAERGVVLLTSFGFDYVPGDLAASLAADGLGALDEIVVGYSVKGTSASRGTRKTIARVMAQPQVAYSSGRIVPSRFGATTRKLRFPSGVKTVVEWSGTEPLTVPRHTDVREVRSYLQAPGLAAKAGAVSRIAAPLVGLLGKVGSSGPSPEKRREARFEVVAEARGAAGARRATMVGSDFYGLTALLIVRAAEALAAGEARGTGALAPAEAFDAATLVERLSPFLELRSVEEI